MRHYEYGPFINTDSLYFLPIVKVRNKTGSLGGCTIYWHVPAWLE